VLVAVARRWVVGWAVVMTARGEEKEQSDE